MKARSSWMVAAAVALLGVSAADAQEDLEGRFTLAIEGGTDTEIAGSVLTGTSGSFVSLPVTIDTRSYRDLFKPKVRYQGLVGYGVGPSQEVVVKGTYYKVANQGIAAGKMRDADLYAFFTDYKEVGGELAYRFYLATRSRLKSYLAPVVGVRHVESMRVSFRVPELAIFIENVPLYASSTTPVFGADIGFGFDLSDNVYVGLETGIRYQAKPGQENALEGFEAIDDGGSRWSAPVVVQLGVRF
jgi:hypothetical protein